MVGDALPVIVSDEVLVAGASLAKNLGSSVGTSE